MTSDLLRSFAFQFAGVAVTASLVMVVLLAIEFFVYKGKTGALRVLSYIAGTVAIVFAILTIVMGEAAVS